jgi:hypothetical protein
MDRQGLAAWSLEISDADFACALAALGVLSALPRSAGASIHIGGHWELGALPQRFHQAMAKDRVLRWRLQLPQPGARGLRLNFAALGAPASRLAPPDAPALAAVWRDFIGGMLLGGGPDRSPRLAMQGASRDAAAQMAWAPWLQLGEVGAASVYLADAFASDGRTDWHWPITLATLPGDPLSAPLADLQASFPPDGPFNYVEASRDTPRVEVLVIGASAADALARTISSGLRLRGCLVVVAGLGLDEPTAAEPLLRALVARLSAEGVVVVTPGSSAADLARQTNQFAFEMAHNQPLDLALRAAFAPGALLLLNRDLLKISRLTEALDRATKRLRALPPRAEVRLTERSFERLGLPRVRMRDAAPRAAPPGATRSAPMAAGAAAPVDLADAIDSARANFGFDAESGEATAITELARSVADEEAELVRQAAVPRHVQQKSLRKVSGEFVEERGAYVVGETLMVQVHIGPKRAGSTAAPTAFPEHRLPPQRGAHRLQVVLHEPRQFDQPMLRDILLPKRGSSSKAEFVFTPQKAGAFDARLSVLHRGRILQTVLLRTQVMRTQVMRTQALRSEAARAQNADGIRLDDETQVRHDWSDLGSRRHFDLALVLNHTAAGQPLMTGVAGRQAWARSLDGIDTPVRKLNQLISEVALSVVDYADGLDQGENPKLLVGLARVGADLYSRLYRDQLKVLQSGDFDIGDEAVTYMQVVSTRPDAVVPLEFMYDFNPPHPGATVCPQHRQALQDGRCPSHCARRDKPTGHVCPMGFWGLKKVIERHLFDARTSVPEAAQVLVRAEAVEGRNQLDLSLGALVGYSQEVKSGDLAPLLRRLAAALGTPVPVAQDWDAWQAHVKANGPALLLAFPHNEGQDEDVLLEIGGKKLYTLGLDASYVRNDAGASPLVFLLGCDVASTAQDFSNHTRYFREAGAVVVVSTIATVFGAHAVRVGEAIVAGLMLPPGDKRPAGQRHLGEIIRDAKRAALLDSVPMAMCVVAFGDADWRL